MREILCDKLRFSDPFPTGWVHTVELSMGAPESFITVWVCSPHFDTHPKMMALVEKKKAIAEHDPCVFHADDEVYKWVEERYPDQHQMHWRQHFHFGFEQDPQKDEVLGVLDELGHDAMSVELLAEILDHFGTSISIAA